MLLGYVYDWGLVPRYLPVLGRGLAVTVGVSVVAMGVASLAALVVAGARASRFPPLRSLAYVYTQAFRSQSTYIYVLWVYFALPIVTGVRLTAFAAAVVSLACLHSAYLSEAYRAAAAAVEPAQTEAAASLGIGRAWTFLSVVLPQAARVALPTVVNQFSQLVKDSALLAFIGVADLTRATMRVATYTNRSFEFYTVSGLMYVGLVLLLSQVERALSSRQQRWAA